MQADFTRNKWFTRRWWQSGRPVGCLAAAVLSQPCRFSSTRRPFLAKQTLIPFNLGKMKVPLYPFLVKRKWLACRLGFSAEKRLRRRSFLTVGNLAIKKQEVVKFRCFFFRLSYLRSSSLWCGGLCRRWVGRRFCEQFRWLLEVDSASSFLLLLLF